MTFGQSDHHSDACAADFKQQSLTLMCLQLGSHRPEGQCCSASVHMPQLAPRQKIYTPG